MAVCSGASDQVWGCEHYRRKCQLYSPCCKNFVSCRFCHDEKEDHELNRFNVTTILCMICEAVQMVGPCCVMCGTKFGKYFCNICKLFDDDDKGQFHCAQCGICRVGGRENFFHCKNCGLCLSLSRRNHKCIEGVSRSDCPICLKYLHTSRDPYHIPPCGHLLHESCYEDMKASGMDKCPTCLSSFL